MSKVIVEVKVAAVNHVGHGPMSDPVDLFLCEAGKGIGRRRNSDDFNYCELIWANESVNLLL